MILNEKMLKLYAQKKKNVLLSGRHGVGKTAIIESIFNELYGEDNWAYFSSSTMDAWVDFVGAPKAVTREDGLEVLRLIRPERFAEDSVKAIFFDEFNRAPPKVRNAVMELIQFKSINGRKFNNLEVIWAAINPHDEDDTYDVERLDPAQLDRFTIQIDMPYKIDPAYLSQKHGSLSKPFVEWWKGLNQENKYTISPRRVDEAIDVHSFKGDLRDVLPRQANITELNRLIKEHMGKDKWTQLKEMAEIDQRVFLQNPGNIETFSDKILSDLGVYIGLISQDYLKKKIDGLETDWINKIDELNKSKIPKDIIVHIEDKYGSMKGLMEKLTPKSGTGSTTLDLSGKTVILTGAFTRSYKNYGNTQTDMKKLLLAIGAKIGNATNGTTDYVISADINSTTSKANFGRNTSNRSILIDEKAFHDVYKNFQ
jgi:hypothetical protein